MNVPPSSSSTSPSADVADLTPMMAQYIEIKTANPDTLLFYRMGDFYELFFEDAEEASRALGITLTKRGKHQGTDIPMCGVPVHSSSDYLDRLIQLGFRVAVCEQMEDPAEAKKRGAKSVVKRDVVRIVTPGTLTEETLLDPGANNYLAALARVKGSENGEFALAWVDLSTGDFRLAETHLSRLEEDIARIEPKELLVSDALLGERDLRSRIEGRAGSGGGSGVVVSQPAAFFDSTTAEERIRRFYAVASLEAFGGFSRAERAAAAAILSYLEKTQIGEKPALNPPVREAAGGVMLIDPATRTNLEIVRTLSGERKGSLLAAIDRTVTGAGARLLAARIASPSLDQALINHRLDAVQWFFDRSALREQVRACLKAAPDMARCLARLTLSRGGPRDLAAIGAGLRRALMLHGLLVPADKAAGAVPDADIDEAANLPRDLVAAKRALLEAPDHLADLIEHALGADLPLLTRDGGFVRPGYNAALDAARALRDESRKVIAGLQATYADMTGIRALKIKHNNVLGYFIEVTAQNADSMFAEPLKATFIHRQTLANAVRFTTPELSELQSGIVNAAEQALAIERQIFNDLTESLAAVVGPIKTAARAMAELDVVAAAAELAERRSYCRPRVDESLAFAIRAGRHPVVERALADGPGEPFIANDCDLSGVLADSEGGLIWLITGPNMAGKSTFLRQNALIALMAQAGLFVPAESAHIGLVDRLFSRVGAADDLARGRSTFMVEMVETAAILNQAGPRALVILDEIGRGTATFDGLSIAWSAIEHLHEVNRSRALFATHYHELTALSKTLERLSNATVKVREWKGDLVFLHEIVPGSADRSYGIQVAKLAGLPASVIKRAREVLSALETSDQGKPAALVADLPLFSVATTVRSGSSSPKKNRVAQAILALDLDDLTPREALEQLYALRRLINEDADGNGRQDQGWHRTGLSD